jgi:hypothetical protein
MEDIERDLANGLLGEDEADDALGGNLTGAYRDAAARQRLLPRDMPPSRQPTGPLVPRATVAGVLAGVLLVLVLLVVMGIH